MVKHFYNKIGKINQNRFCQKNSYLVIVSVNLYPDVTKDKILMDKSYSPINCSKKMQLKTLTTNLKTIYKLRTYLKKTYLSVSIISTKKFK